MISKRFTHFFTKEHATLLNEVIAFRNLCAELYKNYSRRNLYGLCAINTHCNGGSRSIYNLLSTIGYLGLHEQFKYSLKYTDPTSFLFPPLDAGAARDIQLGFEDRYITPRLQLLDWAIEQLTEYNKNVFIKPIPKFLLLPKIINSYKI